MPHTSHRKKTQRTKRTEIAGDDGWTRVTTNNSSQRKPRPLPAQVALEKRFTENDRTSTYEYPKIDTPKDRNVEQVEEHYKKHEMRWLQSDLYKELERCLRQDVDIEVVKEIEKCFVFGTGSFSGSIRGWVDRSHIAMYQLAAFMSVRNLIESITGTRPKAYAQEPVYTELDVQFLSRHDIATVQTPAGFKTVSPGSFVYMPNAELNVELRVLACNPVMVMRNGKLDSFWRNSEGVACTNAMLVNTELCEDEAKEEEAEEHSDEAKFLLIHEMSDKQRQTYPRITKLRDEIEEGMQVMEEFKRDKDVRKLPAFDARDEPFYHVHLFYARLHNDENAAASVTNVSNSDA